MIDFLIVILWIVGIWLLIGIATLIDCYIRHKDDIGKGYETFLMLLVMHLVAWIFYIFCGFKWPEWR